MEQIGIDDWRRVSLHAVGDDRYVVVYDPLAKAVLDQVLIELRTLNARLNAGIKVQTLGLGVTVPNVVTL